MNKLNDTFQGEPAAKRRLTADEFVRMGEAGIFGPDERVELIAGEIYRMSPTGRFHEVLRGQLAYHLTKLAPANVFVMAEMQLRLSDNYQPVADIGVLTAALLTPDARGPDMLLVVEVADSSMAWDIGTKAQLYAAAGVPEYWVVNAHLRNTLVHREPGPAGYAVKFDVAANDVVTPLLVPELATRMADLRSA